MIHLVPNSASNLVYVTPFESRKFLAAFTDYLLVLTNQATEEQFACIFNAQYDNERYTQADLPTNNDDPVNGELLITESGLYTYTIYGQNSDSNLDPTDAVVVGVCEVGSCKVSDEAAWTIPNVTIPDNVIYYE
jgi:hypothetical protein